MILVLTQRSRPNRLEQFYKDNPFLNNVSPFYSIDHPEPFKSFCLSQKAMCRKALFSGDEFSFLLEDDCILNHGYQLDGVPPDGWDLIYLGCNLKGIRPEQTEYPFLRRIRAAWMSHAILYSKKCLEYIVANYQPEESWQMYDDWLDKQLPNLNAYVLNPMIAYQRPGNSDLWGTFTDYTSTIDEGNKLMAS